MPGGVECPKTDETGNCTGHGVFRYIGTREKTVEMNIFKKIRYLHVPCFM